MRGDAERRAGEGPRRVPWPLACVTGAAAVLLVLTAAPVSPAVSRQTALDPQPVPILMYHVIGTPPADSPYPGLWVEQAEFREQIELLVRRGYHGVTLTAVWEHWLHGRPLPPNPIVVSFDDGFEGVATRALPLLERVGWPAVLNLTVEHLGGSIRASTVRALTAAGWELGAHSLTHPDLTRVSDEQLEQEVAGSRKELVRRFGVPVRFFCYPAGRYDRRVLDAVRRAGYTGATTTTPGLGRRSERFTLRRIRVQRGDTGAAVAGAVATAHS